MSDECPKHFCCLPESCGDCPNDENYIESNQDVLGGKPVIKGTRIDVDTVKARLAGGETMDDLITDYPDVPVAAFVQARDYKEKNDDE